MKAAGCFALPWAVLVLVLVLHPPPKPLPATRRRLLATDEPPASQPKHCDGDNDQQQLLEALPHTAPLLRALASFQAVSADYYFPDLCPAGS